MSNIRSGDIVQVRIGAYADKTGKVLRILGNKAVIEGVNIKKKCVKKRSPDMPSFLDVFAPVDLSNVRLFINGTAVKLKKRFDGNGDKWLGYMDKDQWHDYRKVSNGNKVRKNISKV